MWQYAAALDGVKAGAKSVGGERTKPSAINALVVAEKPVASILPLVPYETSATSCAAVRVFRSATPNRERYVFGGLVPPFKASSRFSIAASRSPTAAQASQSMSALKVGQHRNAAGNMEAAHGYRP